MKNVMMSVVFLCGFSTLFSADEPAWLYNLAASENTVIGYGIDKNQNHAKEIAIADIAKTLFVHIDASIDMEQSRNQTEAKSRIRQNISTATDATLSGIKVIKSEKVGNIWYVAVAYDNTPLVKKFKKLLADTPLYNQKQNRYLANTELIQALNREMGKTLDYQLIRKDNLWQLHYKGCILPLKESDFIKLFTFADHGGIGLASNQKIYKAGNQMMFNITVEKNGYVSLLGVEQNGKTGVLLNNFQTAQPFTYPDEKSEDLLLIANPYHKTIHELYVLLQSPTPIRLNDFEPVHEELLDESNYSFHKLLNLMENHNFSTVRVKIK